MKWITPLVACLLMCLNVSCATQALWEATDPDKFIAISKNKVNEDELKARHLTYHVDEQKDVFYVRKSALIRTGDYAIRTLATPVAVAADIVVVGVAIFVFAHADKASLDAYNNECEQKKMEETFGK